MIRTTATLLVLAATAAAQEGFHQPIHLVAGIDRRMSTARSITTDRGIHLGLAYVSGDPALVMQTGFAGVDIDWRHSARDSNRLDSVTLCYSERIHGVIGGLYLGYGIGSGFHRLERHQGLASDGVAKSWRICLKGIVGYEIITGLIVEGAYYYSGKVGGVDTSGITLSAGLAF